MVVFMVMAAQGSGEGVLRRLAAVKSASDRKRPARATVKAAQSGSPAAIEELVRAYWPSSFRLALGVLGDGPLAEDCAQEGLLSAVRRLDTFDAKRPFAPWLHRIILNRAIDMRRARARRPEVTLTETDALGVRPSVGHDLAAALDVLDERARAVVVLKHVLGYRAKEIAVVVGTSEGNVRSILSRALSTLRNSLAQERSLSSDD